MPIAIRIALLRAKMVAKRDAKRAASYLVAAGFAVRDAIAYVLDLCFKARHATA
jgi:hypothetical protein